MSSRAALRIAPMWVAAVLCVAAAAQGRSAEGFASYGGQTAAVQAQAQTVEAQAAPAESSGRNAMPLTAGYVVHPGDVLAVTFRFTPEFNDEIVVQPDGHAVLKAAGDLRLAGYTLPEIQRAVARASESKLVNPDVVVSLKDFERPRIVVAGEVQLPGKFELRQATTALQAILLAGGPKEDGAMNHVYLFRRLNADTAEVHVLKLGKYDAKTRTTEDVSLQPNDMILVRRDGLEKIGRFIKTFNLGVYLNPLPSGGLNTLF